MNKIIISYYHDNSTHCLIKHFLNGKEHGLSQINDPDYTSAEEANYEKWSITWKV